MVKRKWFQTTLTPWNLSFEVEHCHLEDYCPLQTGGAIHFHDSFKECKSDSSFQSQKHVHAFNLLLL